jgi:hypothetical protein
MLRLQELEKYMFTQENIDTISERAVPQQEKVVAPPPTLKTKSANKVIFKQKSVADFLKEEQALAEHMVAQHIVAQHTIAEHKKEKRKKEEIVPIHRDKLFWCFYIIYKGEHEYEQHKTDHFITEKNFKIATAEKLKTLKDKFKQAKLKIGEIEDEMINQPQISVKGLHALCLVYGVSVIYEYNKKYCEFLYNTENESDIEIISLKEKQKQNHKFTDYALKLFGVTAEETLQRETKIKHIRETYWKIENADKPLKVPSAYTIKELQTIAEKLGIAVKSELGKNKTKQVLYEEILTKL